MHESKKIEEFYTKWYTPLYRYIYARVRQKENALDITQTVFIKLCDYFKEKDEEISVALFWTIARNTLIDHYRKKSTQEIIDDEVVAEYDKTDAHIEYFHEDQDMVTRALTYLTEEERELVAFRYWNDLTTDDIAKIYKKSPEAIRKALSRIIQKLKAHIELP